MRYAEITTEQVVSGGDEFENDGALSRRVAQMVLRVPKEMGETDIIAVWETFTSALANAIGLTDGMKAQIDAASPAKEGSIFDWDAFLKRRNTENNE